MKWEKGSRTYSTVHIEFPFHCELCDSAPMHTHESVLLHMRLHLPSTFEIELEVPA